MRINGELRVCKSECWDGSGWRNAQFHVREGKLQGLQESTNVTLFLDAVDLLFEHAVSLYEALNCFDVIGEVICLAIDGYVCI